jgi:hypothetical protein
MRVAAQLHTSNENFFNDGGVCLDSEAWQKRRHPSPPLPVITMSHHLARDRQIAASKYVGIALTFSRTRETMDVFEKGLPPRTRLGCCSLLHIPTSPPCQLACFLIPAHRTFSLLRIRSLPPNLSRPLRFFWKPCSSFSSYPQPTCN